MTYDDDHDDCGSGLGGAVWYQLGRWHEQDLQERATLVNNLKARFSNGRPVGTIYIDVYNNLVAWYRHALWLEKKIKEEWQPSVQNLIRDRDIWRDRANKLTQQRDSAQRGLQHATTLYLVEKELRQLAEQGHSGKSEYQRLANLQQAAVDEFCQTGELDDAAHEDQAIATSVKLQSPPTK